VRKIPRRSVFIGFCFFAMKEKRRGNCREAWRWFKEAGISIEG